MTTPTTAAELLALTRDAISDLDRFDYTISDCRDCSDCSDCGGCSYCIGINNGIGLKYIAYGIQLTADEFAKLEAILE